MISTGRNQSTFSIKVPDNTYDIITIYMILVCLLSGTLNSLAAYVLLFKDKLRSAQSVILFSLTTGNAIFTAAGTPLTIYANYQHGWTMGAIACTYYGSITFSCGLSEIYHLLLLSFERFIAVVHPFENDKLLQPCYLYLSIILSWAMAFLVSSLPIFGWSRYTTEGIGTSCSVELYPNSMNGISYNIFIMLIGYMIPMSIIIYFNVRFLKEVQRIINRAKETTASVSGQRKEIQKSDKALMKQMSLQVTALVVSFNISWLPYAVIVTMGLLRARPSENPLFESIPSYFAKSYSLYDPILFFILNKKFRLLLFGCSRRHELSQANIPDLEMRKNETNRSSNNIAQVDV